LIRKKSTKGRRPVREEDSTRINERIRVPEVRLIGADGEQVGVVATPQAMIMARDAQLDLVEVSPNAVPPVCRIMDYGKFKFELAKKEKASKAKQHIVKIKEIKLHPKTDDNDLAYRIKHAIEFLDDGCKVKFTLIYRGREMAHQEFGRHLLVEVKEALAEEAELEVESKMEGNSCFLLFAPSKKIKKKVGAPVQAPTSPTSETQTLAPETGADDAQNEIA
jgi:translation initiation factor IF-3